MPNPYLRRLAWMFMLGAMIATGDTVRALAAEAPKQSPAATAGLETGKPAATIRMAPLDLKSLDAKAFGDWDHAAAAGPSPKVRQR